MVEQLDQYPGLSPRQKGVILINEFGCVSCHTSSQNHFKPRRGPDLSGLGNRVKPEWLKGFLKTPDYVSAGATHLDFPAEVHDSEDMSRSQIENALNHYLFLRLPLSPIRIMTLKGQFKKEMHCIIQSAVSFVMMLPQQRRVAHGCSR